MTNRDKTRKRTNARDTKKTAREKKKGLKIKQHSGWGRNVKR